MEQLAARCGIPGRVPCEANVDFCGDLDFTDKPLTVAPGVRRPDVFVLERPGWSVDPCSPIKSMKGQVFVPVRHYDTSRPRCSGASRSLRFDRRVPDRGYAFVGTSQFVRVLMCWLPIGFPQATERQLLAR